MLRFPIICYGGIGDVFAMLARVPIAPWGRWGVRFNIFYTTRDHPAWKILESFLRSLPYCCIADRAPSSVEMRVRNLWIKFIKDSRSLYAPPLPSDVGACAYRGGAKRVLLQSHLDGHHGFTAVVAKKWPVNCWCELARRLHDDGWTVELLEWDPPSFEAIMRDCPFIKDGRQPSLLETVQHARGVDCVVSVDSWTKYVAGWWNIPQVVIVPDLRKGYTPDFEKLTADEVARSWFRGLTTSPTTYLLGLEQRDGTFEYTLPSIVALSVHEVEDAVKAVTGCRKSPRLCCSEDDSRAGPQRRADR